MRYGHILRSRQVKRLKKSSTRESRYIVSSLHVSVTVSKINSFVAPSVKLEVKGKRTLNITILFEVQ